MTTVAIVNISFSLYCFSEELTIFPALVLLRLPPFVDSDVLVDLLASVSVLLVDLVASKLE